MDWKLIVILILIIYGVIMMVLYLDKGSSGSKSTQQIPTLDWIKEFYAQTKFPLTSPLTPQQFKTIKETIALLVQHEHYSYNRVPDIFDMYASEETKTLAKMRKSNHLENHQRWRQIGDMMTRLTVEPEILPYLNDLMQNNPEFVLFLWGVPTPEPLELQTEMLNEIKKYENNLVSEVTTSDDSSVKSAKEVEPEDKTPKVVDESKPKKPRIYKR